jgi:hypothetical protein
MIEVSMSVKEEYYLPSQCKRTHFLIRRENGRYQSIVWIGEMQDRHLAYILRRFVDALEHAEP